jgi:hypothetical protein
MLLSRKHEDCECQLSCQDHLNNDALSDRCPSSKFGANIEPAVEERIDDVRSGDGCSGLRNDEEYTAEPGDRPDECHAEGYLCRYIISKKSFEGLDEFFCWVEGSELTTGLKRPPLILKNVHAVIAKLNPAANAM